MTPKEKAAEIYSTIYDKIDAESESVFTSSVGATKDIALYLVNEVINAGIEEFDILEWNEVKEELNKL